MSSEALQTDQNPILACTICRDVQNFELLIVDMEEALGEQWGDLGFEDAVPFMAQPEAEQLEFIAIAMDDMDEDSLDELTEIITEARNRNIRTLLIAEDVTPASLHTLLRHGADEFTPLPAPARRAASRHRQNSRGSQGHGNPRRVASKTCLH